MFAAFQVGFSLRMNIRQVSLALKDISVKAASEER
jgi:hypothetical protein